MMGSLRANAGLCELASQGGGKAQLEPPATPTRILIHLLTAVPTGMSSYMAVTVSAPWYRSAAALVGMLNVSAAPYWIEP